MAATKANLIAYPGNQDVFGGHGVKWYQYKGPSAYYNPGGESSGVPYLGGDEIDTVSSGANQTGLRSIGSIDSAITVDGLYSVFAQPGAVTGPGAPTKWFLRWFVISTGLEVANGVNLSGSQTIIMLTEG